MVATLLSGLFLTSLAGPLPLKVVGTEVLNSRNEPVWLRGVNCAAMEWSSDGEGKIFQTVQVAVEDWKVNHVRIPLSQDRWFGKAPEQTDGGKSYQALLKRIVDYCNGKGVYVMIDLHWNSGAQWGKNIGQHKLTDEHSILFWKDVAQKYKNHPAVIFDLYNEPHSITWDVWRDGGPIEETNRQTNTTLKFKGVGMKELLKTVRDTGAKNVVVVGGLDWSYDMSGFLNGYKLDDPKGNGIIYANHAYPFKGDSVEKWMEKMETARKSLPMIVSEFGSNPDGGNSGIKGDVWVKRVVDYLQEKRMNWTAWDMHPAASPILISDWFYNPTPWFGVPVLEALTGKKVPGTIIPVVDEGPTKAGHYDWPKRHQASVDYMKANKVELILLGDSITHAWGGHPMEGGHSVPGQDMYEKFFGSRKAVNLGFGWDGTQHVLWRFAHGALDHVNPKAVVIMIGTNNVGWTPTEDIVLGISTIVKQIRRKLPDTKILLLGIFPRDEKPDGKNRKQVIEVNARIKELGKEKNVTFLDFGNKFLQPDGTFSKEISPDFVHLTKKGYEIWAREMEPTLSKLMGDTPRK